MRCDQARQLFDAYLDGELSPSLATELGAHRLRCPECRRALALLEVTGHVIAHDRESPVLQDGFADRLLSCTQPAPSVSKGRWVAKLYVAGPLAAAALVVLAILGAFDRRPGRVAGRTERAPQNVDPDRSVSEILSEQARNLPGGTMQDPYARSLDEWAKQTQQGLEATRESGASFQELLDLKMSQVLGALREPAQPSPGAAEPGVPSEPDDVPAESDAPEPDGANDAAADSPDEAP